MIAPDRLVELLWEAAATTSWPALQGLLSLIEDEAELDLGDDAAYAGDLQSISRAFLQLADEAVLRRGDMPWQAKLLALELLRPTGERDGLMRLIELLASLGRERADGLLRWSALAAALLQIEYAPSLRAQGARGTFELVGLAPDERSYVMDCLALVGAAAEEKDAKDEAAGEALRESHPDSDLLPGDCLFRDLSPPLLGHSGGVKAFGHVAIYLGLAEGATDARDWANHEILEMVGSFSLDCLKSDVASFRAKPGFWGGYGIALDTAERRAIVKRAESHERLCKYGIRRYKDPKRRRFRCDGFIEHLYERQKLGHDPFAYRGGLFEADRWNTLSPAALRNCLTEKRTL